MSKQSTPTTDALLTLILGPQPKRPRTPKPVPTAPAPFAHPYKTPARASSKRVRAALEPVDPQLEVRSRSAAGGSTRRDGAGELSGEARKRAKTWMEPERKTATPAKEAKEESRARREASVLTPRRATVVGGASESPGLDLRRKGAKSPYTLAASIASPTVPPIISRFTISPAPASPFALSGTTFVGDTTQSTCSSFSATFPSAPPTPQPSYSRVPSRAGHTPKKRKAERLELGDDDSVPSMLVEIEKRVGEKELQGELKQRDRRIAELESRVKRLEKEVSPPGRTGTAPLSCKKARTYDNRL
ncbi:hypothetical protein IAT38_008422 [Cryptococcus sp. DSM 104549]